MTRHELEDLEIEDYYEIYKTLKRNKCIDFVIDEDFYLAFAAKVFKEYEINKKESK